MGINLLYKSYLLISRLNEQNIPQHASCPLNPTLRLPCFVSLSVLKAHLLSTTDNTTMCNNHKAGSSENLLEGTLKTVVDNQVKLNKRKIVLKG